MLTIANFYSILYTKKGFKKMEKINENFDVPYYIFKEIVLYVEETAKGRCRCMKWENIKSLLRLAQMNNRLTEKQVEFLIQTFCRE